mgnify:CR=1 FL=1|jgi:hypothetical protein
MKLTRLNSGSSIWLKLGIAISLIAFVVVSRILPHPANFASVAAIALFGGAILPRRWAVVTPVAAMVASDLIIGLHPLVLYTWGCFAVIAFASNRLLSRISVDRVAVSSMAASVFFFLVTNFGVWMQGQMYPMTASGLVQCYINAIPFFRGTLLGDLFYSGLLFGVYAIAASKTADLRSTHAVQ